MAKRLASLALAGALVFAAAPQALAADTIGGADTAQVPVSQELEQENCIQWLLDLLGLGSEARMNTPSTLGGNWVWRARPGFASRELAERLRHQMELYHRLPPIKVVPDDYARRGATPVSGAGIMRTGQFRFRI